MNSESCIIKLSKNIYNKEPILKAAYIFSDVFYVYVDENNTDYLIKLEFKNVKNEKNEHFSDKEFINEVIVQSVRYNIMQQTKNIRELILGRALASTMVNDSTKYENDSADIEINDILVDWFDKYDNS
ncbi:MAG: His-Xaa-Ser system protein HxsD [Lachnospiraceae bacterium]|nr:His-Xaa-Ser system protein HxsD [Lachnospiraceae bacterium]